MDSDELETWGVVHGSCVETASQCSHSFADSELIRQGENRLGK